MLRRVRVRVSLQKPTCIYAKNPRTLKHFFLGPYYSQILLSSGFLCEVSSDLPLKTNIRGIFQPRWSLIYKGHQHAQRAILCTAGAYTAC